MRHHTGDAPVLGAAVQKLVVTGFVHRALHRLIVGGGGAEVRAVSLDKLLVACCVDTHTAAAAAQQTGPRDLYLKF